MRLTPEDIAGLREQGELPDIQGIRARRILATLREQAKSVTMWAIHSHECASHGSTRDRATGAFGRLPCDCHIAAACDLLKELGR